jgi:hypothetical protein
MNYYKCSKSCVENNNMRSFTFNTTRGVKQGGSLSPFLFAIYFNEMITKVVSLNLGALLGNSLVNIIVYADDILLVADCRTSLQSMLDIITQYGNDYEVKFNPSKTVYTIFNNSTYKTTWEKDVDSLVILNLSAEPIMFETKFKYLGVLIDSNNNVTSHLEGRFESFENRLRLLNKCGIYNMDCSVNYRSYLLNSYAKPILLYGLELFQLNATQVKNLENKLNNRLKVMYDLSTRLKSTELLLAHRIIPLDEQIKLTKLQLYARLFANQYTREILDLVRQESSNLFVNNSLINDIIVLTGSKSSNLIELYNLCGKQISEQKTYYKNLMNSEEINHVRWLLDNKHKNDLEILLLAF